ncbi:MAG: hypothetical protein ACYCVD_16825 [Desulfitobacteriaceae bacterium]
MIQAHEIKRTLTEVVIDPLHVARAESAEFRHSKERLKADGHYRCWVCGCTENLQVHHMAEWMFANVVDFAKLKPFVEEWDVYGYGRLLKNKPLNTVDDLRALIVLCQHHHTGVDHADGNSGTGIHNITFPAWLMQKLAKSGKVPIPQDGDKPEDVLVEIERGCDNGL